jgi:hypothetical protein
VVYAIAESRAQAGLIWAGTNDGLVQFTRDGGKNWTNVTANIPGIPTWGSVRHIEPSRYDAGTAYIICDAHQENDRSPYVWKTNDFGKSWKLIVNGLPKIPMGYAHIIREDPVRRGLLYLGTENALYVSFDDGERWQPLQLNLPHAPVYGMIVQEQFNDLVISTYGRGIYILDDLSPLQKLTPAAIASNVALFQPRAAYRFRDVQMNYSMSDDPTAGQNPQYGADINYWLKSAPRAVPTIAISDAAGKTVLTFDGTSSAGINRVYWDLRNEPSKTPRLRTKPLWDDVFELGADGTRDAPDFNAVSVQLAPGRYTVKLSVDGQTFTQPLDVLKDPRETIADVEMKAGIEQLMTMQADLNVAADAVNSMESLRVQFDALRAQLANDRANADLRVRGDSLEEKVTALEGQIINLQAMGTVAPVWACRKFVARATAIAARSDIGVSSLFMFAPVEGGPGWGVVKTTGDML